MNDAEALKAVQHAVASGDVRFDASHFADGVHHSTDLNVDEVCEILTSPFATVTKSTTDRDGRVKLEIAGPHVGSDWIVVVIMTSGAFVITVYEVRDEQDEEV